MIAVIFELHVVDFIWRASFFIINIYVQIVLVLALSRILSFLLYWLACLDQLEVSIYFCIHSLTVLNFQRFRKFTRMMLPIKKYFQLFFLHWRRILPSRLELFIQCNGTCPVLLRLLINLNRVEKNLRRFQRSEIMRYPWLFGLGRQYRPPPFIASLLHINRQLRPPRVVPINITVWHLAQVIGFLAPNRVRLTLVKECKLVYLTLGLNILGALLQALNLVLLLLLLLIG